MKGICEELGVPELGPCSPCGAPSSVSTPTSAHPPAFPSPPYTVHTSYG